MRKRTHALATFVRRVLMLRIAVVGVGLAVAFGTLAYLRGYERIDDAVVLTARFGIERLRIDARSRVETASADLATATQQALDALPEAPPDRRYGEFVYVRFLDPTGAPLAELARSREATTAALREVAGVTSSASTESAEIALRKIDIAGHPHIHLVLPVHDRGGKLLGQVSGVFRVSEESIAQARRAALENALYVAAIVLWTSLLLYPVIVTLMRRLAAYSESLLASNLEALEAWGRAIAKRDSDTDAHNYRVTLYSLRLGEALGLDPERQRALVKGAFLHDVGKIGTPDRILHKPGRLDADEFAIMQLHVQDGLDIVRRIGWLEDAQAVVGGHHEKFDGSGYPARRAGADIPIEARIFAIADVFDALTSRRPYKEPLSFEATFEILDAGRGKHFDPDLLDRFKAIARELYERYSGRDDSGLRDETREAVNRLFVAGLETLRY